MILFIIFVIIFFVVLILNLGSPISSKSSQYTLDDTGECVPPIVDTSVKNRWLRKLVPYCNGVHIHKNQALVIHGLIPLNSIWWSFEGFNVKDNKRLNASYIISDMIKNEYDYVYVVLTPSRNVFNRLKSVLGKTGTVVVPILINNYNPENLYTVLITLGVRSEFEIIPSYKYAMYTFKSINSEVFYDDMYHQYISRFSERKLLSSENFRKGCENVLDNPIKRVIYSLHLSDDSSILKFKTPIFTIAENETVTIISVDHSRTYKARMSTVTLYDDSDNEINSILSGDNKLHIVAASTITLCIMKHNGPFTGYIQEEIYPEVTRGQKMAPEKTLNFIAFVT